MLPATDGTSGQVLSTDGAGNLSWATATSGGGGSVIGLIQYGFGAASSSVTISTSIGATTSAYVGNTSATLDYFPIGTYDSAFYNVYTVDNINHTAGMGNVSVSYDPTNSLNNPYAASGGIAYSAGTTPQLQFSAITNTITNTVSLLAQGATTQNSASYFRINLGVNTPEDATAAQLTNISANVAEGSATVIDTDTSFGTAKNISSTAQKLVDQFAVGAFDSAFYIVTHRDETTGQLGQSIATLVTDGTNVVVSSIGGAETAANVPSAQISFGGTLTSGQVRLTAIGATAKNSATYYRIGLGTNTTSASNGAVTTSVVGSVGTSNTLIDSWVSSSYRSAKYFISITQTDGQVSSIQAMVTTKGTDVSIASSSEVYTGAGSIITLSATMSGSTVQVYAAAALAGATVKFYRIILSSSNSQTASAGTYADVLATQLATNASGTFDTFSAATYNGMYYLVSVYDSYSSPVDAEIIELFVTTDGSDAYLTQRSVNTGGSSTYDITFSATYSSGTVTITSVANQVGITYLNGYRIKQNLPAVTGTYFDSWSASTYRGAKYYISVKSTITNLIENIEALVVTDGTSACVTTYEDLYVGSNPLINLSVTVFSGNVQVQTSSVSEAYYTVRAYRVLLQPSETPTTVNSYQSILAPVTVATSGTTIDSWSYGSTSNHYGGATYIVVSSDSTNGVYAISEVQVACDGTNVGVASSYVSNDSTGTLQPTFVATLSGTTVTLKAFSNSGGSSTFSMYRVVLTVPVVVSTATIDSFSPTVYRAAKYSVVVEGTDINEFNYMELGLMHDGTNTYLNTYGWMTSGTTYAYPGLVTFSAAISGGLVKLQAVSNGEKDIKVNLVRQIIAA